MPRFHGLALVLIACATVALRPSAVFAQSTNDPNAARQRAQAHLAAGKYEEAVAEYQRAVRLAESAYGPNSERTAFVLTDLARLYLGLSRFAEAEPLFRRAVKNIETNQGANHPNLAVGLTGLARLFLVQARYAQAVPLLERALKIREQAYGADHTEVADSLGNLGTVYHEQGRLADAERLQRRCLKILEARIGTNNPDYAQSLHNLATVLQDQGRYAEAEPLYQRSLKIQETEYGPSHKDVSTVVNALATLYFLQDRFAEAEPLYRRALQIRETTLGPDDLLVADTLNNLAVVSKWQQKLPEAEALYLRSLKIKEQALGLDHPSVASNVNNLAALYAVMGRHAEAEPLYQRSLKIWEETLGPEHPDTILALFNQGHGAALQSKFVDAIAPFDRSRRAARSHIARLLPMLGEAQQLDVLRNQEQGQLHECLSLALAAPVQQSVIDATATWLANGKGISHAALAKRALLTRDVRNPQLAPLVNQLLGVRQQLAGLSMSDPPADQIDARRATMQSLTTQEAELSAQLTAAAGQAIGNDEWTELPAVRQAVPEGAVLIDLARFQPRSFVQASGANSPAADAGAADVTPARYVAWIIPPAGQGEVRLIDLGDAAAIDAAVAEFRAAMQRSAGDGQQPGTIAQVGEQQAEQAIRTILARLTQLVLTPLVANVGNARELILSPDGALWLVPWAALPLEDGQYAIEKYDIRYVISSRDVIAAARGSTQPTQPVVLADPNFDLSPKDAEAASRAVLRSAYKPPIANRLTAASGARKLPRVDRLPGTATEAQAIVPSLETWTSQKPQLYSSQFALESVFKKLSRPRILVLSTHGFFLPEQEVKQAAFDVADPVRRAALTGEGRPLENPLLRCGLLLAGCNQPTTGADDGILTGLEIVGADLRGTELVVLSACETGLGDVRGGEGVAGLRQAFQLAGAEAVVATLWQIPDRDTAIIMSEFFRNLAGGQSKAAALRSAQLKRIADRRERNAAAHPLFWAAFTLTGRSE